MLPLEQLIALGLAAFLLLIALVHLCRGLFEARSLLRREFTAYFISPIAYVVLAVFLIVTGHLFSVTLDLLTTTGARGTEWPMQTMFADERFWLVFLFIPPVLTMRLFAEERATGTLEVLMTSPLRDWQIVLCKYLACLGFYVVLWLPTLVYLPALLGVDVVLVSGALTLWSGGCLLGLLACLAGFILLLLRVGTAMRLLSVLLFVGGLAGAVGFAILHVQQDSPPMVEIAGRIDPMPVLSSYLGMFLAGAMFLSIGLFVSSLVRDQLVSALVALLLSLLFLVTGFWRPSQESELYRILYNFSVPLHFDRAFTRGIIDVQPLVLYSSVTVFCLFITVRSLESRRWQ
jgi:ABC-type transport system involved in multi-copper enzyme maturation permease subunit